MTDPQGKPLRTRVFTVPAGTRLPDGTVLADRRTFTASGESGVKAQRSARRLAADTLSRETGTRIGPVALNRATGEINVPAGRGRGGRPARELPFDAENRYGGKRVDIYLGKPRPLYQTVRAYVEETWNHYPSSKWHMSIAGKGELIGHQGPDYTRVQWVSTAGFDSFAAFQQQAPDARAFERWIGVRLRKSEDWTLILYEKGRQSKRKEGKR